ncbi:MogA/MoaB family molybdenum cofactor biosynthesis protein [Desulfuromonas acetoxidans]|uniref:MogA/MoaB family molybdenum cofactor biosynthesis protein n=1 Tax=Desulfuromonas acetoxidans TaxID=891 RepID=UPI00292E70C8|nr:MogA/MoaB family molybdenum cofactor biosynthesis protein [Desulfuromonas acetoxidans]
MKAAVLILSDKGAAGKREDLSGPALIDWLEQHQVETLRYEMIPDDYDVIVSTLTNWCDEGFCDVLITCGGTGVSPRDVTPEATMEVVDRILPGFGEAMRAESLKITPMAILSRAMAGIRGICLVMNLPGSPKAAIENLEAVWPAVAHGVDKIGGNPSDCAGIHS